MTKEQEYLATAKVLADAHRKEDPGTTDIYLFADSYLTDIRLLEVSENVPNSGEILPFTFLARPDLGINFTSTLILLSPSEWQDILSGNLLLPSGWYLSCRERL